MWISHKNWFPEPLQLIPHQVIKERSWGGNGSARSFKLLIGTFQCHRLLGYRLVITTVKLKRVAETYSWVALNLLGDDPKE